MSEKKLKTFCRKIKAKGIYSLNFNDKEIFIADRDLLKTDDPKLIQILEADPEVEIYLQAEDKKLSKKINDSKKSE